MRARVPLTGGPMFVDFNEGASAVFAERSDVSAERRLSVQEIIARHQQQQRAQDAFVRNYIASARTEQHFRPTMTDPGYDVVTDNRYFVASDGIEWEELSFSVNGSKWGADRPPFPLLQAEKVLSLPLQLRFDNDYRYRLEGTERVGEYRLLCRAVRSRGERAVAVPGDDVDRAQDVRAREGVRRADRPLGAGRLQRGDPDVRADRIGGQQAGLSLRRSDRPADHPDCRTEHPRREDRGVRGFSRQRSRLRRGAQRAHDEATASCIGKPTRVCGTT